jgi:hypothetical protein
VSREGTILRKRTEPLSFDKFTLFMVIASTNSTEGTGIPTEIGEPRSLRRFPLKVTCVAGWDEALSIGILGWVVAQPKIKKIIETKRNMILLEVILIPPFSKFNHPKTQIQYKKGDTYHFP